MTSWNGNIFRVTGHLCGELIGPRWIPTQRPVTRSFDVVFDLRLNKRLSKQSKGWWFETPSRPIWHHRNVFHECSGHILAVIMRALRGWGTQQKHYLRKHCTFVWKRCFYWQSLFRLSVHNHGTRHQTNFLIWNELLLHLRRVDKTWETGPWCLNLQLLL